MSPGRRIIISLKTCDVSPKISRAVARLISYQGLENILNKKGPE